MQGSTQHLEEYRIVSGPFRSNETYGFNGAFFIPLSETVLGKKAGRGVFHIICSDQEGWEHVSVKVSTDPGHTRTPTWEEMCTVKDLFWSPDEWVVQYHPAQAEYVNNHPNVLHLWKPLNQKLPTPPAIMVGVKK